MLIAAGDDVEQLVSRGCLTTTEDGVRWTTRIYPFTDRANAIAVAKGSDRMVVMSDRGFVSTSSDDGATWSEILMLDGQFSPAAMVHGMQDPTSDIYMACGQFKFMQADGAYVDMDEAGQIYRNTTGDDWDWELVYSHWPPNSRFHGIRKIEKDGDTLWVALGAAGDSPIVVYSVDWGLTWNQIALPSNQYLRRAYDIAYDGDRFWISANGMVLSTSDIRASVPTWDASPRITPSHGSGDLLRIAVNATGDVVAVCSGGIYHTNDGTSWALDSYPGYRFKSVIWWDGRWVVGAEGDLRLHTIWQSTDTITWTTSNNLVQAYDLISTS